MRRQRIVIVGGGFGAVACARALLRATKRSRVEVVLFSLENHFVFTPLLADVVGASVKPLEATVPLRTMLPGVFCRTEEVVDVDRARREIVYLDEDGNAQRFAYDHVVLACGTIANLDVVPGMAKHAFPLKTILDAVELRAHVMAQMERAETTADPERRRRHLSFVVIGGGYSGVEAAGEINDLVRGSARHFKSFEAGDVRVTLVHSQDELLKEISPSLRDYARRQMVRAGVEVRLKARAAAVSEVGVTLEGGELVPGGTVVCTIGTQRAPLIDRIDAPKEKGRLLTRPDLRLRDEEHVWASETARSSSTATTRSRRRRRASSRSARASAAAGTSRCSCAGDQCSRSRSGSSGSSARSAARRPWPNSSACGCRAGSRSRCGARSTSRSSPGRARSRSASAGSGSRCSRAT